MIKLVAFDWNGTLFADTEPICRAVNKILAHFKAPAITKQRFQETFDQPMTKFYSNLGFKENFVIKNQKTINKVFTENYEPCVNKCRSRTGAKEVLTFLQKKNITSIIYSNHTIPDIIRQTKRLGLYTFIKATLARELGDISHYHSRTKEQKLYNYVRQNKVKPNEVISIGDSEEEIEIGKTRCYHTVAITGGYNTTKRLKKHNPDFLIHNLKELIPIIKKLNK